MVSAVEREIRRLEAIRAEVQARERSGRKPRTLSAEGRRKIAEAQHRRWARAREAGGRMQSELREDEGALLRPTTA